MTFKILTRCFSGEQLDKLSTTGLSNQSEAATDHGRFADLKLNDEQIDMDWQDNPAAVNMQIPSDVPPTVRRRAPSYVIVAECVQNYITAMDFLKLNMVAVDQIHPVLWDLLSWLNRLNILPCEFEGRKKVVEWIGKLAKMGAADELTDQQARQMHFDLNLSYNLFMAALLNVARDVG